MANLLDYHGSGSRAKAFEAAMIFKLSSKSSQKAMEAAIRLKPPVNCKVRLHKLCRSNKTTDLRDAGE